MHEQYQSCINACKECAVQCDYCVTACLQESDVAHRVHCIQMLRDCADMCAQAVRWMSRGSSYAPQICSLCADICEACATACAKHKDDHCRRSAETCRKCAEECRSMAEMAHTVA